MKYLVLVILCIPFFAFAGGKPESAQEEAALEEYRDAEEAAPEDDEKWAEKREEMVAGTIGARGVSAPEVLAAMRNVPRHEFVPRDKRRIAYTDQPLPIGHGQTISQPYIVAYMTEVLDLNPGDKVLEIGTGSGYQAAVLAEITDEVYTIEIIDELAESAAERLRRLGYNEVRVKNADGYYGWDEYAPFDAIIVTAAAGHVPSPLINQLAPGGRIVIPIGGVYQVQQLTLLEKSAEGEMYSRQLMSVRFVPFTGAVQETDGN
jgi:protein-L-isoaspartate(D-aspartate) O-methyltransferase